MRQLGDEWTAQVDAVTDHGLRVAFRVSCAGVEIRTALIEDAASAINAARLPASDSELQLLEHLNTAADWLPELQHAFQERFAQLLSDSFATAVSAALVEVLRERTAFLADNGEIVSARELLALLLAPLAELESKRCRERRRLFDSRKANAGRPRKPLSKAEQALVDTPAASKLDGVWSKSLEREYSAGRLLREKRERVLSDDPDLDSKQRLARRRTAPARAAKKKKERV
jgi:hypothetical protein